MGRSLEAVPASPGIGIGRAAVVAVPSPEAPRRGTPHIAAADRDAEASRLRDALDRAAADLDALARSVEGVAGSEVAAIFAAQALFARDPGIIGPAIDAIHTDLLPAEVALGMAADRQADVLLALKDELFRQRAADLRDVARRVIDLLAGREALPLTPTDGSRPVIVAHDLDASQVAQLRREIVAGIALAAGAPTGHAAIVSRAIGIPMVVGAGSALEGIETGMPVAVDGTAGRVILSPSAEELASLASDEPSPARITGQRTRLFVALQANVASVDDVTRGLAAGADGVGLVRSELLFLGRHGLPSAAEQEDAYRRLLDAADGRPMTFRTFDFGGDKPVAGMLTGAPEPNPALGMRGVRQALIHPEPMRVQLGAMLRAAAGRELRVMFPMISTVEEVRHLRALLDEVVAAIPPAQRPETVSVGVMVEVPAAALGAAAIAREVDFMSIGTNDLAQYLLAADRTHPDLRHLTTGLQPAVLAAIAATVRGARATGIPVAVCGEAAGDPRTAPLLLGLGVSSLSMDPARIPSVHEALAAIPVSAARRGAAKALEAATAAEVDAIAAALADLHGGRGR
jgi:phosphoenolpyruvate-protein phosphotransferase